MQLITALLVYFHGSSFDELHKHVSPDVLPEEFGGRAGTIVNTEWKERLSADLHRIIAFDPSEIN